MTYLWLALAVLAVVVVCCLPLWRRVHTAAAVCTAMILMALTAVFDNIMIALNFFHYAPEHLSGVHIGIAPIEDFSYPLAAAVLLPAVWHQLLARRRRSPAAPGADRDDSGQKSEKG